MKKHLFLIKFIALLTVVATLLSFASCYTPPPAEEEITDEQFSSLGEELTASIDEGCNKSYSYVSSYLDYWGVPEFDDIKLKTIERYYYFYYYFDLGYDDTAKLIELSTRVARAYVESRASLTVEDVNDSHGANTDAVINAYVSATGDPYSIYRNPKETADYDFEMGGSFAGIGVYATLDYDAQTITVVDIIEGSAAEAAGILPADVILAVDGNTAAELGVDRLMDMLRGEIGTPVTVTILRDGEELSFTMNRVALEESSVKYALFEDGTAYVYVSSFNANTDEQFIDLMNALEESDLVKGYIIDLRYNGGGYLETAANMLSYLVPKGTPVICEKTRESQYWHHSTTDHTVDLPIVILCNEYSASASELFLAAVRDYRDSGLLNASIVGVKTYGKGQAQRKFSLSDGSSITLTFGLFNPPCDVNFDGVGITPDVEVALIPSPDYDNQFDAACEELSRLINESK